MAGAVQDTCSSKCVKNQGADFLRGVAFLNIRFVGLLKWFCVTRAAPSSIFRGRRNTLDRRNGKIAKCIGTRPSALHSTFNFWRKSRRIALFLRLANSIIEEVSQNYFVLDVVQIKKWRILA
jgi:hypothetical protein